MRDILFGLRTLRRSPWFTAMAVVTLALGIGATTAVFSVVDAVLLRSFGYADPARLVQVAGIDKQGRPTGISSGDFLAFQQRAHFFQQIGASRPQSFTLTGSRDPENFYGQMVTAGCLRALGAAPWMGRVFRGADYQSGAPETAVVSYIFWQTSLEGDPNAIGRRVMLNGTEHTVVGVMRPEFQYPHPVFRIWVPWRLTAADTANHSIRAYTLVARLRPGVSPPAADAELKSLSQSLAHDFPSADTGWRAATKPVSETLLGSLRPILTTLMGAVAFVLLMACLNVSNLLMARGILRSREIALRSALGAPHGRLVRQLLVESVPIAVAGAAAGIVAAYWGLRGIVAMLPSIAFPVLPGAERAGLDGRVLAVCLAACVGATLIFGLAPALLLARPNLEAALREGGRCGAPSGPAGLRHKRLLGGLIALEAALSVVLLAGAGLMLRSFSHLLDVPLGFRPEHVLTAQIPSAWTEYAQRPDPAATERKMQSLRALVHRMEGLPGVTAAGLTTVLPLSHVQVLTVIHIEGRPEPAPGEVLRVAYRAVSPGYFRAMGIPLLRGRTFTEDDRTGTAAVAIVSERMAHQFWPGEDVVGRRLSLGGPTGPWTTVVGMVGSVRFEQLTADPSAELYTSYVQTLLAAQVATLALRTAADPAQLAPAVRAAIHEVDPNQPITDLQTMARVLDDRVAQRKIYTVMLSVFAGLALLLAAAGIFSVISWTVSQTTHEIGIRMALGATPRDVLRVTMGRALAVALSGGVLGTGGALALTGFLKTQLYGVTPADPPTLAAALLLLGAVAWLAAYVPARRATRVDPMAALRCE
jgi:putative ABC transport system permease protein